jgi:uncharacterized protein (DUF697 family)/GTPase Era involved in 16S rRNA processing
MNEKEYYINELYNFYKGNDSGFSKLWNYLGKNNKDLNEFKELILEKREPRFAIVGRRGAGKSSLINAIFSDKVAETGAVKSQTGFGKWFTYEDEKGKIEIFDSRGLGEGSKPMEEFSETDSIDEIKKRLKEKCPDMILFLCKAKETDSRIDEDIKNLEEINDFLKKECKKDIPVTGVITQVDELDPAFINTPPYDNIDKQNNINSSVENLRQKLSEKFPKLIDVIPTSAYIHFNEKEIEFDRRWNIDKLIETLIDNIPKSAQLELAKISEIKTVQKKLARRLVKTATAIAGGIATQPIPVADMPVITSIQIGMVVAIGYIGGKKLNKNTAMEFLSAMGLNVGIAFTFREIARGMAKLIPFAGSFISAGIAAAGTYAIGQAAITYFIDKKGVKEAKELFEKLKKKKEEKI